MIYRLFIFVITMVFLNGCANNSSIESPVALDKKLESKLIRSVMSEQESAWNDGDIEKFMEGYWNSEDLTFIGSRGLKKGWQTTLDGYNKSYPDDAAMGRLAFEINSLDVLSEDAAYMIGRYTLYRDEDEPTGLFTLLWRKIDGEWLIVADQTC